MKYNLMRRFRFELPINPVAEIYTCLVSPEREETWLPIGSGCYIVYDWLSL